MGFLLLHAQLGFVQMCGFVVSGVGTSDLDDAENKLWTMEKLGHHHELLEVFSVKRF